MKIIDFLKKKIFNKKSIYNVKNINPLDSCKINDIIHFSFMENEDLSNETCNIVSVSTYYVDKDYSLSFEIENSKGKMFYISSYDKNNVHVSMLINHGDVTNIFDQEQFAQIFSDNLNIKLTAKNNIMPQWIDSKEYNKVEHFNKVKLYESDLREKKEISDKYNYVDYYYLLNNNENMSIDIEVFNNGNTEVYVSIIIPNIMLKIYNK